MACQAQLHSSEEEESCPSSALLPASVGRLQAPSLRGSERFHVFISYSSADSQWVHEFIAALESSPCGLELCYHDRDFVPGQAVLENMSICIQDSQKVLLVLSPDFLNSRWCLLETNMSLLKDCLEHKPVVPVLLQPGLTVPLHLCHLTYLEARDPHFLRKVIKVLSTPNHLLRSSMGLSFHHPALYSGKLLLALAAADEEGIPQWKSGEFSDMALPDQLRVVIRDPENYLTAIRMINCSSQTSSCFRLLWVRVAVCFLLCLLFLAVIAACIFASVFGLMNVKLHSLTVSCIGGVVIGIAAVVLIPALFVMVVFWGKNKGKKKLAEMQTRVCQANIVIAKENLLIGCESRTKLYFVYVSLEACRDTFEVTFREKATAADMFLRAMRYFSSGYACCLARKYFPFPTSSSVGHLEGGVCFCRYVGERLRQGAWS
ncbi:TLR1 protein, partial [Atractosteus spatula]|nr:TLR1 protein [Atractosteus spatula]